jgi:hypothetical protein
MRAETRHAIEHKAALYDVLLFPQNYYSLNPEFGSPENDTAEFGADRVLTPPPKVGVTDRLLTNGTLKRGQSLSSQANGFKLTYQSDGNVVVYDSHNHPTWASGTNGKASDHLIMQGDGNLVLYNGKSPVWATGSNNNNGAIVVMQSDGNLVVYTKDGKRALWASQGSHGPFDAIGGFVSNAVAAAGKEIGKGVQTVASGLHEIQHAISSIPVVGGVFATLYDLGSAPFTTLTYVAEGISKGESFGAAIMDNLNRLKKELTDVLPWVATIISIFPVFGPLASSIIMTASALLEGQPIEEVLITAALSIIPGMAAIAHFAAPLIEFGIKLAKAIAKGAVDFAEIIIDGIQAVADLLSIQIPDYIKKALVCGIHITAAIARGMKATEVVLSAAIELLKDFGPQLLGKAYEATGLKAIVEKVGSAIGNFVNEAADHLKLAQAFTSIKLGFPGPIEDLMRKVFGAGLSLGSAANVQGTLMNGVKNAVGKLVDDGKKFIEKKANDVVNDLTKKVEDIPNQFIKKAEDLALSKARDLLPANCRDGFHVGIATMQTKVTPFQLLSVRSHLDGPGKQGFDTATALHVGRVVNKPITPKKGATLAEAAGHHAGFMITTGMQGLPPAAKKSLMKPVAANPVARVGAVKAVTDIAIKRTPDSWWTKFMNFLHIKKHSTPAPVKA